MASVITPIHVFRDLLHFPPIPTAPLLRPRQPSNNGSRPSPLSLLLSRAASTTQRRGGASMMVRETAARELEERRADWGYSKPVVALDIMWNLAFVVVSVVMLICTAKEKPSVPIRVWVCGIKRCESVNTMVSFLWWIVGFYWVVAGGEVLLRGAPRLYWRNVHNTLFPVPHNLPRESFCSGVRPSSKVHRRWAFAQARLSKSLYLPGCFLRHSTSYKSQSPIYRLAVEGASEADLSILPKYRFQMCKDEDRVDLTAGSMVPIETSSGYMANERILSPEDAECCICLSAYEDGTELHALPCNHHFHSTCIVKWLKMNATCPLCKYNILKGNDQV
ncbi:hypothetical protein DH2020_043866 [Rehmannia glutinosa]|uniref:RING-type E3 ubiquitin transferase n=1 Tax=Rehmannia glutinosa TaxID=99300 RepID=A0ABR0UII4_REHGL